MKNVLEFCLSPDLGGLELFVVNCYRSFQKMSHCSIVVAPQKKLDKYLDKEQSLYIKRNKFFPLIPAYKLAKIIDAKEIDVVHFHWTRDIATVVLAKILSKKKPKIIQTRNMNMTRFKSDVYHRWLYKNIDAIHAVTFGVKEQLEQFIPQDIRPKIEVVYMGTEAQEMDAEKVQALKSKYALREDDFVVGIVGRIEEVKGQYLVIEALHKLHKKDIKLLIVGHTMDATYLRNLKKRVEELGLTKSVIFTGFTKEVNEHMSLFDVNILATPKETFGLVVIEAMMNRVCMIATNNGGPLEIIEDGVDGLLFDRSSEDLAKKIELLYTKREYKQQLAEAGYKKAKEKFSSATQNRKLFEFIASI